MEIAILPGVTCAVVRIKIDAVDSNENTVYWKIMYKEFSATDWITVQDDNKNDIIMCCPDEGEDSNYLYGYGPNFYDLTGLDSDTKYKLKLVLTDVGGNQTGEESVTKVFTTCEDIPNEHKISPLYDLNPGEPKPTEITDIIQEFNDCMEAVGYDCYLPAINNPNTNREYFQCSVTYRSNVTGTGGYCTYGGSMVIGSNNYADFGTYVHEYRHFLGLDSGDDYHGDVNYAGFHRPNQYYQNICNVAGFARGIDDGSMEIYMFNGENSVESMYMPNTHYLGFFLLKALGLNDVYIEGLTDIPYQYRISVYDSDGSTPLTDATVTWYEDENYRNQITSNDANCYNDGSSYDYGIITDNHIHLLNIRNYDEVWVKISCTGYTDIYEHLDSTPQGYSKDITMTLSTVEISALPIVQKYRKNYSLGKDRNPNNLANYYDSKDDLEVGSETIKFVIVVKNNQNKKIDYNLSIENYCTQTLQEFSNMGQLNIGDDYSIFIIHKQGYTYGDPNNTIGTFTISSDYSDNVIFRIKATGYTEHDSNVRCVNTCSYSNVFILPYKSENINMNLLFYGVGDGAAIIEGNTAYFYESFGKAKEVPSEEITYSCYPNYDYYVKNVNTYQYDYKTISFDSNEMIEDLNFSIQDRKSSNLTYSVTQNRENRLRFGIVRLSSNEEEPYYCNCKFLSLIIQESENIRIGFLNELRENKYSDNNIICTIDLSKDPGYTYTIPFTYPIKNYELWFWDCDIRDKIIVKNLNGEVTADIDVYDGNNDTNTYGTKFYFESNVTPVGGRFKDGYQIIIK